MDPSCPSQSAPFRSMMQLFVGGSGTRRAVFVAVVAEAVVRERLSAVDAEPQILFASLIECGMLVVDAEVEDASVVSAGCYSRD